MRFLQTEAREGSREIRHLKKVWGWLRTYKLRIALSVLALAIAAGAELCIGQAIRLVVDKGLVASEAENLDRYFLAFLGVIAVLALATFGRISILSQLGERVTADIRQDVYNHVIGLSASFYEKTRPGEVLSRLTADTTTIQNVLTSTVTMALRNVFLFFGGTTLIILTSPKLAGTVFLLVPVVITPMVFMGRRVRRLSRTSQDEIANLSAVAEEGIRSFETIQAFTHESYDRIAFGDATEQAYGAAKRRVLTRALLGSMVVFLIFSLINLVLWIGARDLRNGNMTAGDLTSFVFYALLIAMSVGVLSEIYGQLQRAAGAAERILELLDTKPDIVAPPNPIPLPEPSLGLIEFDNVSFWYPSRPDRPALNGFSLRVEPGETIALVGPSGAGKSTVLSLLLRFFDPQAGRVLIDGVDVAQADPQQVRSRMSHVAQDPVIFSASAAENIRYGRPDASDAEIRQAAEAAVALEFINDLPDRFESHLGERGVRLSGGQKQRMAIARAFLRDSSILLFDEATSALDSENERLVQNAMHELVKDRTAIIIAHRLATVKEANRIIVMDGGDIVASGTHDQLMAQQGLYAELARMQFTDGPSHPSVAPSSSNVGA